MVLRIAYLINQYPKVSHSFIRREIFGVEACGVEVSRFSIRSCETELVDDVDQQEQHKTQIILKAGIVKLVQACVTAALTRPIRFLKALNLSVAVGWKSASGIERHLIYLVEACLLREELAKRKIQHLHVHFGTNSTTVAMLCQELGGPSYSFTIHGPEEFDAVKPLSLIEKIERAAFVVAISDFGKSQLYRWCPQKQWPKIHIVRCGLDQDYLQLPPSPVPELPQLVCVGRLCEQKGQLVLIAAAKCLVDKGIPFKLVLVGDGPMRSQVEDAIAQANLQDYITITGWADTTTVQHYIRTSRALVLPSFAEGLPVVLMEALAMHRPVVSTYVAGIPELVEPGLSGWLVPSGTVEELSCALAEVLQASTRRLEEMGRMGAKRVLHNHNQAMESQKLVALFKTCSPKSQLPTPSVIEEVLPDVSAVI